MFDIDELNKQNDRYGAYKKFECAKVIFLRASNNDKLNRYFAEDRLKQILDNVRLCSDEEKFKELYASGLGLTKKEKEQLSYFDIPNAFVNSETNLIYIKCDTPVDTIVHEMVHALSNIEKKETGIYEVMKNYCATSGVSLVSELEEIDSFNEAITHYITQILMPEVKVSDGYNYGADIVDKYSKLLVECGKDSNVILDAYFFGNQKSFDSIGKDFGNHFSEILESINGSRFIFYYKNSIKLLSEEQLNNIFNNIKKSILTENKINLDEYTDTRKAYQFLEQDRISENLSKNEVLEKGNRII